MRKHSRLKLTHLLVFIFFVFIANSENLEPTKEKESPIDKVDVSKNSEQVEKPQIKADDATNQGAAIDDVKQEEQKGSNEKTEKDVTVEVDKDAKSGTKDVVKPDNNNDNNSNKNKEKTTDREKAEGNEETQVIKELSHSTPTPNIGPKKSMGIPRKEMSLPTSPTEVRNATHKEEEVAKTNTTEKPESKCVTPAISQFPRPLMSAETRAHGGIIIHLIVAIYMFIGLAIVCDEYFVSSLDRICEELKMSPDVAGATFMAAGSSAPELATVVIGVFLAHDDIGLSGVIGSAVFNIMFVVSVCALCSGTVIYLNWWPMVRDSFFYLLSILAMLFTINSETISWGESLFMLVLYVIYCVVLHFNTPIESWAQTLPLPFKKPAPAENVSLMNYKSLEEEGKHSNYGLSPENVDMNLDGAALNKDIEPREQAANQGYYKPKDTHEPPIDPLIKPEEGIYRKIKWAVCYPIHFLCKKTVPDCRTERWRNWYPLTFFAAMVWISFYSYFMVWMITIIGYTMGVPDTVMGLTFVAAGVSVPDALSSVAVIKEGYGDMAVSNAIGSNVFDILICLGLPWFIKTAIKNPGSEIPVTSRGLEYSTVTLLSTVVFLVVATHLNGWKLDKKFGLILLFLYLLFITLATLYEMNVFGNWVSTECPYKY